MAAPSMTAIRTPETVVAVARASSVSAPDWRTLAAFLITVLFLGVNFVAVRFSNLELPPLWGAALRFAIASAILLSIVTARRIDLPTGRALIGTLLFGALLFGANYGLLYWALLEVSSGMAAVVFATIPLLTLLLAVAVGLERFGWRAIVGALITILGIGVVFQDQLSAQVSTGALLAALLAAACAALATVVVKRFPRTNPLAANTIGMGTGASLLFVASLLAGDLPRLPSLPATWVALAWLIASSIIAFVLMVWVLSRWSASATSYSAVLIPLVTVAAASLLAGETITPLFVIGAASVLGGVYLGALGHWPKRL